MHLSLWAQEEYSLAPGKKIIITDATFKKGSAVIEESQRPAFARLAEYLKQRDHLNIEIGGHADNTGTEEQNVKLSLERAEAVREYLIHSGIAASRIRTRGYGSTYPIADNATEEGRTRNRRVEIIGLTAFSGKLLAGVDGTALAPDARITMLKPVVRVMPAWENTWHEATINQPLYEAFKISTDEGARADITFRNNSVLHIRDNTLVMIYGFSPQQRGLVSDDIATVHGQGTNVELTKGVLTFKLRDMRQSDTFSVKTRVSQIGFNTHSSDAAAKIYVDNRQRSIISVLEGQAYVKVTNNDPRIGQVLRVSEDFGIIVGDSLYAQENAYRLPPMPVLHEPIDRVELTEGSQSIRFAWESNGYPARLEVATNADFSEIVYNQVRRSPQAHVILPAGKYFVRLTSIDSIGFESKSLIRALVVEYPQSARITSHRFRYLELGLFIIGTAAVWAGILISKIVLVRIGVGMILAAILMLAFAS
ncbi:MAG: OmpA family protein [Bacteroidota bacterium]|nr:OmpA family protein [Candidatus Kapabacteria bacterium]MDW8218996.1 OmpA family protein [Bacteroidota bacterium]